MVVGLSSDGYPLPGGRTHEGPAEDRRTHVRSRNSAETPAPERGSGPPVSGPRRAPSRPRRARSTAPGRVVSAPGRAARCASLPLGIALLCTVACTGLPRYVEGPPPGQMTAAIVPLAQAALDAGQVEAARRLYGRLLTAEPYSAAARMGLGDIALRAGDATRAGRWYADAIRHAASPAERHAALLAHGRAALSAGNLGAAHESFVQLAEVAQDAPVDRAWGLNGIGLTQLLQGRMDAGIAAMEEATRLSPDEDRFRENLARARAARRASTTAEAPSSDTVAPAEPPAAWSAAEDASDAAGAAGTGVSDVDDTAATVSAGAPEGSDEAEDWPAEADAAAPSGAEGTEDADAAADPEHAPDAASPDGTGAHDAHDADDAHTSAAAPDASVPADGGLDEIPGGDDAFEETDIGAEAAPPHVTDDMPAENLPAEDAPAEDAPEETVPGEDAPETEAGTGNGAPDASVPDAARMPPDPFDPVETPAITVPEEDDIATPPPEELARPAGAPDDAAVEMHPDVLPSADDDPSGALSGVGPENADGARPEDDGSADPGPGAADPEGRIVEVAAYDDRATAELLAEELRLETGLPVRVAEPPGAPEGSTHQVLIGPLPSPDALPRVLEVVEQVWMRDAALPDDSEPEELP